MNTQTVPGRQALAIGQGTLDNIKKTAMCKAPDTTGAIALFLAQNIKAISPRIISVANTTATQSVIANIKKNARGAASKPITYPPK